MEIDWDVEFLHFLPEYSIILRVVVLPINVVRISTHTKPGILMQPFQFLNHPLTLCRNQYKTYLKC